ncbi:MAG: DUF5627 domain-containing protein [Paludibacter sp.]
MKIITIKIIIGFFAIMMFASCENEPTTFDDFDYTTCYFGWQYPVRTLVLGQSEYYDNSNDLKHQFEIKASIGGLYSNTKNVNVGFEFDSSLTDSLGIKVGNDTVRLKMLPSNYYEPITTNSFAIPTGSMNGGITIKLTDAFFNDPLSYTNKYVLPVRILNAETDTVLKGKPALSATNSLISSVAGKWGVDPRVAANWIIKPQNFTIYAIKYINKYHGFYLRVGAEKETTVGVTATVKNYGREKKYIEYTTYIPKLSTLSLNKLLYADKLALTNLNFKAVIDIATDNNVTISKDPTSTSDVVGTGKFVSGVEEWGGKKRDAFYLNYTVTNPSTSKTYAVTDTLVIRDNAVMVETFAPIIIPKK